MISVIVAVRNGMPWLDEQLRALAQQQCDEPWEVVVADNGSTDKSRVVVQEWANRAHMIRLIDAIEGQGTRRRPQCGSPDGPGRVIGLL